jgi:hypothetical protein
MSEAAPSGISTRWRELPSWARLGAIALLAGVIAVVAIVVFRVVSRTTVVSLGVTAASDLQPGSCLAEDDRELEQFTVVSCDQAHPQQVFVVADISVDDELTGQLRGAVAAFADEVCERHVEYRLYLDADLDPRDYTAIALDVPSAEGFTEGDTLVRCAVRSDNGSELVGDLYRPLP